MSRMVLLISLLSLAIPSLEKALAQEPKQDVPGAISRGLKYVRDQQDKDGRWLYMRRVREGNNPNAPVTLKEDPTNHLGLTALAALALIENGVPPSDPAVQAAYSFIRQKSITNTRTYNLALTVLFLTRLGSREDRPLVQRLANRIMLGQLDSGGWSYTCPTNRSREGSRRALVGYSRKEGMGDNSNTQFAVLGVWASTRAGANAKEALELAEKRFRNSQASAGGWDYRSTGTADTGPMTAAGLFTLTVAAALRSREVESPTDPQQEPAKTGLEALEDDESFRRGYERIEQFTSSIGNRASPYFLWSLERLGVTLGRSQFGEANWYEKGRNALLRTQSDDGSWQISYGGVADTSLALLFLRKANLGRDISYALKGDQKAPFILLGDTPQGFEKLEQAIAAADGDATVQIMGNGPFDTAGVVLKDGEFIIRAGEGFTPVLLHKPRLIDSPASEPRLQSILQVESAAVTLEGVHFQIDPLDRDIPWKVINANGAKLRLLHCALTQTKPIEVSGITVSGECDVQLRNNVVCGFKRGLDLAVDSDISLTLENNLFYTRLAIRATGAKGQLAGTLSRNTFQVGEVLNLEGLDCAAEFRADGNIFKANFFSSRLLPRGKTPERSWAGDANLYDQSRWLGVSGRALREVRNLDGWRKYWKASEKHSGTESARFAVRHRLGPFKHTVNPNDWRPQEEPVLDGARETQVGCDPYLVGPGQAYYQFRDSSEYDAWGDAKQVAEREN